MIRIKLAILQFRREVIRICHPRATVLIKIGTQVVSPNIMVSVLTFLAVYVAIMVLLIMVLILSGLSTVTAASAVVACISDTGPGLNEIGPATTYAVLTEISDLGLLNRDAYRTARIIHGAGHIHPRLLATLIG